MDLFPKKSIWESSISTLISFIFFITSIYFLITGLIVPFFISIITAILTIPFITRYLGNYKNIKWPLVLILALLLLVIVPETKHLTEEIPFVPFASKNFSELEVALPTEGIAEGAIEVGEKTHHVSIISEKHLDPPIIDINSGDTVIFLNKFSTHVLHLYQEDPYKHITMSGRIPRGSTFSYTFNEPGEYFIRDLYFNIRGKVVVG